MLLNYGQQGEEAEQYALPFLYVLPAKWLPGLQTGCVWWEVDDDEEFVGDALTMATRARRAPGGVVTCIRLPRPGGNRSSRHLSGTTRIAGGECGSSVGRTKAVPRRALHAVAMPTEAGSAILLSARITRAARARAGRGIREMFGGRPCQSTAIARGARCRWCWSYFLHTCPRPAAITSSFASRIDLQGAAFWKEGVNYLS